MVVYVWVHEVCLELVESINMCNVVGQHWWRPNKGFGPAQRSWKPKLPAQAMAIRPEFLRVQSQ